MPLNLFDVWYFALGFLLANGIPHFVFGRAGKPFRSPFGRQSPPKVNVAWGLANFVLASVIGAALAVLGLFDSYSVPVMLLGFWLMVAQFGFGIRRFLGE